MDLDQDIVTSFYPMYYLSTFIGLTGYVCSGPVGNRIFEKFRFHIIYHAVFFIIHLFLIIMSFIQQESNKHSRFDLKIVSFGIYTTLFISIVVILCHHLFKNGVTRTLNEIYDLDKQMNAFGIQIDHAVVFRSNLCITMFLILTAIWYSFTTIQSTFLYEFYYWILFALQYLVTMTMKSQFCVLNVLLKYRFIALDVKLKEVIDETKDISESHNKIIMVRSANKNMNDTVLSPIAEKIITLSEFHSKLYNISKRLNLFYSVQILLITGKYFVEITATLYYNLQKFYQPHAKKEERYDLYAFSYFSWAMMNAIDLLVLVYVADSMCSAANNSKLTLHKVNLNSKDIEMKKEVTAFSLQLLHNDLVLTAAGFFNIDFTLIFNIIGAVTTYLVIFIQFDITPPVNNSTDSTNSSVTPFPMQHFELTTLNTTLLVP